MTGSAHQRWDRYAYRDCCLLAAIVPSTPPTYFSGFGGHVKVFQPARHLLIAIRRDGGNLRVGVRWWRRRDSPAPAATAPSITTQPASVSTAAGQPANFSVVASGSGTLTYQWRRNGTAISGANSASYGIAATTLGDNGAQFTVVVSNSVGSVASNAAVLSVTAGVAPAQITTQPQAASVSAWQTATFTVVATGTAPLAYQWRRNGTNIAGAAASSYTTTATTVADNGAIFDVQVSNAAGSVTSAAALLTVTAAAVAPAITTQPANQTVSAGQSAVFSVVASGTAPL
ncbi:MAG: immunoglobulin domain-containing protein, partial [bacterium]